MGELFLKGEFGTGSVEKEAGWLVTIGWVFWRRGRRLRVKISICWWDRRGANFGEGWLVGMEKREGIVTGKVGMTCWSGYSYVVVEEDKHWGSGGLG